MKKTRDQVTCSKCGSTCDIDGDPPKYFAFCDTCDDHAQGFDPFDYAVGLAATRVDAVEILRDIDGNLVLPGAVYKLSVPQFIGAFPIRTDFGVLPKTKERDHIESILDIWANVPFLPVPI
jgi:hypothetical protein